MQTPDVIPKCQPLAQRTRSRWRRQATGRTTLTAGVGMFYLVPADVGEFNMLPRRWLFERTSGWRNYYLPFLVRAGHLRPLGKPAPYNVEFIFASDLLEQVQDRTWVVKVTKALDQYWYKKNANKKNRLADGSPNGHPSPVGILMLGAT